MSAVGESGQPAAVAVRPVRRRGRVLQAVLRVALVVLALGVLGAGGLAWRLSQGPLDVTWLARRVEAHVGDAAGAHLTIGSASLAWEGFQRGAGLGLDVRLRELALLEGAAPVVRVASLETSLSLLRLLQLEVVPRTLAVSGVRARAVRGADGEVTLGGAGEAGRSGGAGLDSVLAQLRRPAGGDRDATAGSLGQLRQVTVRDARLVLDDGGTGGAMRVSIADLDLARQAAGGVKGSATGEVAAGSAVAALRLTTELLPGGGTRLAATLAPTSTQALAPISTQGLAPLAPLGAVDAPIQGEATLDLSPAMRPETGSVRLEVGGGTVAVAGGTVPFQRVAVQAEGRWADGLEVGGSWVPAAVTVRQAQLVLASPGGEPTTLSASGTATRAGGTITAGLRLQFDQVEMAGLGTIWPAALSHNLRSWLVENVTGGSVRDGDVTLKLTAPEARPAEVTVVEAGGTMRARDLVVHWLRPVPPMEHGEALVTIVGPDEVDVAVQGAAQGGIAVTEGTVRFTGLTAKDQIMDLTTHIQGKVADLLVLLRHPRLKLLAKHPLPIKTAGGNAAATLHVQLPLLKDLDADQVTIAAQGKLSALRLGGMVAGRDLSRGEIGFDVTQDGLKAGGPAALAGIASTIGVEMDFRAGPPSQVLQRASVSGTATARELAAAGFDPSRFMTGGQAGFSASYTERRDGTASVEAATDLKGAALTVLGWRKAAGAAAEASARLDLADGKLTGVERIDARGPGLAVRGRAEMAGGKPRLLELERIELGPTRASGAVTFPAGERDPVRVRLAGPMLDLSTGLDVGAGSSGEGDTPVIADLRFERVELGRGRVLTGVATHVDYDGQRVRALRASSSGPARIEAVIAPEGRGRRLTVQAEDAGALLRALDVTDTIGRGVLAVNGNFDDSVPSSPLAGTADLSGFSLHDGVAVGKVLQAITIYGIADALRGPGLAFDRMNVPFRYDRRQLIIGEARAFSSSLGVTAKGWVDFARGIMDVRGTIVPAYEVNSALGRIPLVGRLFSPERGGGLVAVNYSVTGPDKNPRVVVNPLSALTPGFLREVFNVLP